MCMPHTVLGNEASCLLPRCELGVNASPRLPMMLELRSFLRGMVGAVSVHIINPILEPNITG